MSNRMKIAHIIALAATAINIIGVIVANNNSNLGNGMIIFGILAGLISYFFSGFGVAIRMAFSISKLGFLFMPVIVAICTFPLLLLIALIALLFIPIIPVRRAYKESLMN